ncbi:MAG: XdhC family protein [Caldilineaceae bacterium]|nr:XdhC family protein [Caldilineaceae bacterium]
MTTLYEALRDSVAEARLVAAATVIRGAGLGGKLLLWPNGATMGSLGSPQLDETVRKRMMEQLATQQAERFTLPWAGETLEIFVDVHAPPPKLVIVGAVHMAIPLVTFGKALGFYTVVLDARSAFATPERFAHADRLLIQWPADALPTLGIDESTCVVVLTHDEKIDNPALAFAVRSPARYIGALGSKKTHARRVAALHELGVTDAEIARIHAPIGLDIGARRPEEIAVSIIAQIVAVVNGAAA